MRKIEYTNKATGEVTESHRRAVEWYSAGDDVAVLLNGKQAAHWEH